jgi:hypothetical protein
MLLGLEVRAQHLQLSLVDSEVTKHELHSLCSGFDLIKLQEIQLLRQNRK